MARAGGIILNLSEERAEELQEAADWDGWFPEVVNEFQHSRNAPLICFLGIGSRAVTHIAQARRGVRAGVGRRRLNVGPLTRLERPVPYGRLLEEIEPRFWSPLSNRLQFGGILPPGTFQAFVEVLGWLAPDIRASLERFSASRRERIARLSAAQRGALAYQKEALATAMSLAGIDRAELQNWEPPVEGEPPRSFLDGLPQMREREDMMVVADLMKVPGFDFVREAAHGAALFENDRVKLTVVMANHLPLEEQLGGDLIYFNETYRAFVVVQYKAMEGDEGGAVFRLPNAQLSLELQRMDAHVEALRNCAPNDCRSGYRMLENPFFLKLCARMQFNPDDAGLVKGMYLPLDYWRFIETDESMIGRRGGRIVSYQNVGRYLDNSSFIGLVANAWIGTTIQQSEMLESLIREVMASGRTVTLAMKSDKRPPRPLATTSTDQLSWIEEDEEEPPIVETWN